MEVGRAAVDGRPSPQSPSRPSIRVVLDWYTRRLTADRFANRRPVVVPPELAGWVVPHPGDPVDTDGLRPLGAVRDALDRLVADSGITAQERMVIRARHGLSEYPAGRSARALGARVPVQRVRNPHGLAARRLRTITESGVQRLDDAEVIRPHGVTGVTAGPVPDPALAGWFVDAVAPADRPAMLEQAIAGARVFVCVAGYTGDLDGPLQDLDDYVRALESCDWTPRRPLGRSRAHALVGISLWRLTRHGPHDPALTAVASGVRVPPPGFVVPSPALGSLLAGDVDSETVLAACRDAARSLPRDHGTRRAVADLLVGLYERHRGRLGDDAQAAMLESVVRLRASDEDPTVLALTRILVRDQPRSWWTLNAAQTAVRVASGNRLYRIADELCDHVDEALRQGVTLPPGRVEVVEVAEFRLWNLHQRTGTLRRQLGAGVGTAATLQRALRLADLVHPAFHDAHTLNNEVAAGDLNALSWYWLLVRGAEIHLAAAARTDSDGAARHVATARQRALEARRALSADGLGIEPAAGVHLTKVELAGALVHRDWDGAIELLRRLAEAGWPLDRALPVVRAAGVPISSLPPCVVAVIDEIREREDRGEIELIVDGAIQRRWERP